MEVLSLQFDNPKFVDDLALGDVFGEAVQEGVVLPPRHSRGRVTFERQRIR